MTMMIKKIRIPVVVTVVMFLAACTFPHPPLPYDPNNPLKRVAVLPMRNDTNDVDGPDVMRQKMVKALESRSYVVKDLKETDQILRDRMGITLGGQLDLTTAQKLGQELGVEGVLYGTLMDFDESTLGAINVKKVRGKFRLVNTATGQDMWARGLGVRSEMRMQGTMGSAATLASRVSDAREKEAPWVTIEHTTTGSDSLGKSFAIGVGSKLVSKAIGMHLDYESTELARRVTADLPWGPGPGVPAVPKPAPVVAMPTVKAPEPPSFGHMEFGKKDFSAIMVSTTIDKNKKDSMVMEASIAKSGEKFRSDMDTSKMTRGQQGMPPDLSRTIMINRGDKNVAYTLYPNKKKYITHNEKDTDKGEEPKVEKTKVGSEVIDGHPTDKFRVKITNKHGKVDEGFEWNAKDLDGMTIRTESENNDFKVVMEIKNVVLKRPDNSLFEIPADYTESKDFMDLMTDSGKK
ncbi:MAG: GNA1162 family protein [Nitrospirota bacterium]